MLLQLVGTFNWYSQSLLFLASARHRVSCRFRTLIHKAVSSSIRQLLGKQTTIKSSKLFPSMTFPEKPRQDPSPKQLRGTNASIDLRGSYALFTLKGTALREHRFARFNRPLIIRHTSRLS